MSFRQKHTSTTGSSGSKEVILKTPERSDATGDSKKTPVHRKEPDPDTHKLMKDLKADVSEMRKITAIEATIEGASGATSMEKTERL
ncbi:hypothetical protein EOD39_20368 [Acipenser ruthenus]|uniref:Uncharacterized protein n=1 Tax=Acipenser ruthenus TaxID=7906 RepID=A0A444TYI1_ACIRT|nr:hypothetical protein EOD39_20368 [Acipenser ruthenus]